MAMTNRVKYLAQIVADVFNVTQYEASVSINSILIYLEAAPLTKMVTCPRAAHS